MKMSDTSAIVGDEPKTFWTKLLTSTPVVMTVISTLLAGLSTSEMSRAQYDRSMAAQQQSLVGDQWGYFQAKKLRSATLKTSLEMLEATSEVHALTKETLASALGPSAAQDSNAQLTLDALATGKLPHYEGKPLQNAAVQKALDALVAERPEEEIQSLVAQISPSALIKDINLATENTHGFDHLMAPILAQAEKWKAEIYARRDQPLVYPKGLPFAPSGLSAAWFRLEAARYDQDSRYNSTEAHLKELLVRVSNLHAERHHLRSKWFFFGMLASQLAVILATFALALKRRSVVWSVAAALGLAAVAFGVYVYGWV